MPPKKSGHMKKNHKHATWQQYIIHKKRHKPLFTEQSIQKGRWGSNVATSPIPIGQQLRHRPYKHPPQPEPEHLPQSARPPSWTNSRSTYRRLWPFPGSWPPPGQPLQIPRITQLKCQLAAQLKPTLTLQDREHSADPNPESGGNLGSRSPS